MSIYQREHEEEIKQGKYKVSLFVYDLSRGMAKQFSGMMGKQIDGIWHTSICAYGIEWYFGGGILKEIPKSTQHGEPLEIVELGITEVPKELFQEFLNGQTDRFRMDTYHLLENNCNHFTNECSNFLLGRNIPSHITDLPAEFLNSPMGTMLGPMINNFFGQQNTFGQAMAPVKANNNNYNNTITPSTYTNTTSTSTTTSSTTTTTTTRQVELHPKSVTGHKHLKLVNSIPLLLNNKPILFEKSEVDSVFNKLKEFAVAEFGKDNIGKLEEYEKNAIQLKQIIKSTDVNTPVSNSLLEYFTNVLFATFSEPHQFPLLEIQRMLLLKNQSNQYFTNKSNKSISNLIKSIILKKDKNGTPLSKATILLSYRVINNCFFNKNGIEYLFDESNINDVIECTIDGLHSMDKVLKRAVSTLVYNISLYLGGSSNVVGKVMEISEFNLSLLGAVEHVLKESESVSSDPEIDFRLLMALGTLIYCNDDLIEILSTLEFNFDKYLNSKEPKIVQLTKEIKQLLL